MGLRLRGLITAIRTLTILPVGGRDAERFSDALVWFPFVGGMLGGALWLAGLLWNRITAGQWPEGGALAIVGAEILLSGALHLDGLADWADALGGGRDREARLRIMKDPHLGSFGVVALVIVLLAKWAAWTRLLSMGNLVVAVPVLVSSRAMMAHLITRLPSARSGEGMAGAFLKEVSPRQGLAMHGVSLCLCAFFGPAAVGLYGVGWLGVGLLGLSFRKAFGGITGDLLGTANELVEIALLVLCASMGGVLACNGWGWLQ